jgi:uncharacterized membrane protein YjfL (UPF0719 family)
MLRIFALIAIPVSALYAVLAAYAIKGPMSFVLLLRPFATMFAFLVLLVALWPRIASIRSRNPALAYAVNGSVVGLFGIVAPVLSGVKSFEEISGVVAITQVMMLAIIGGIVGWRSQQRSR